MKHFLARFRNNEKGAVTVDWVVITAGIVALGITSMSLIGGSSRSLATDTGTTIAERLHD